MAYSASNGKDWSMDEYDWHRDAVSTSQGAALGGAVLGGAVALALIGIAIALVWQYVTDQVWRNIILIVLLIVAIVIALMWLWVIFRAIAGWGRSC